MDFPQKYNIEAYNEWYNKKFNVNVKLIDEVEKLRNIISQSLFEEISIGEKKISHWLGLRTLVDDILKEFKIDGSVVKYTTVPSELGTTPTKLTSNFLKPTNTIINKMWRITRKEDSINPISLSDLKTRMKDLVRFSIKTDSLHNCDLLAKEFQKMIDQKSTENYKKYWDVLINSVRLDAEMKTATGYFAYHFYFELKMGIFIEMQIYSVISDSWRTLSHTVYEKIRDDLDFKYKFNDVHTRIIAIGHLLYLAECELYNLENELNAELKKE